MPADGPMTRIAVQHYTYAANLFIYISGQIDQALSAGFLIDDFGWESLRQLGEVLCKLETCLFGSLPRSSASDVECLFMVTGKSRRGRPATAMRRYLRLADRHECKESWGKLTLHSPCCDRKGGCDCRETTRREPRKLIKYLKDLPCDSRWVNFLDLALVVERLYSHD
jgi:hypothetical protein